MNKKALLIIDVQNVYFSGKLRITYPADSFDNILKVMDYAAAKGIPIVIIQHSSSSMGAFTRGSEEWKLHPEIERRTHDVLIEKNLPGSFTGTGLEQWLRKQGIETVIIAGYMTHMCCDTTARQAVHLGFKVEFLSDATGTLSVSNNAGSVTDEELHRVSLVAQAMRFSKVLTTGELVKDREN